MKVIVKVIVSDSGSDRGSDSDSDNDNDKDRQREEEEPYLKESRCNDWSGVSKHHQSVRRTIEFQAYENIRFNLDLRIKRMCFAQTVYSSRNPRLAGTKPDWNPKNSAGDSAGDSAWGSTSWQYWPEEPDGESTSWSH